MCLCGAGKVLDKFTGISFGSLLVLLYTSAAPWRSLDDVTLPGCSLRGIIFECMIVDL